MSANYGNFGKPYKGFSREDPVDACMPGRFLDAPWNYNLGNCKQLMAQRCSENWDEKCQLFVNNIDDVTELKHFLESMANHRFCNLDRNSKCGLVCEPFNPIDQVSPSICRTMGDDPMVNAQQEIDTGLYNPVKLSPVYMGGCMKTCNKIQPSEIKKDDKAINYCLEFGFCGETLSNICKTANDNKQDIKHPLLKQYCSLKNYNKKDKTNQKSLKEQNTSKTLNSTYNSSIEPVGKIYDTDYSNNIGVVIIISSIIFLSLFMIYKNKF